MASPEPLELAVRENATWCDLVCRSHRLAPESDRQVWWSARRTPSLYPDAITLDAAAGELDVLGRIHDTTGASVKDSFARLDLEPMGYTARFDATWIARPPSGAATVTEPPLATVRDKFTFAAWAHAWGGPDGVLLPGLLRTSGVVVVGAHTDAGFHAGAILHHTKIRGIEVVGLSNIFGPFADAVATAAAKFPGVWLTGYESGDRLTAGLDLGFTDCGPLRVWARDR